MFNTEGGGILRKYLAAAIQLDSQEDKKENLKAIASFIDEAAGKGAKLVGLPECMIYCGREEGVRESAEEIGGETTQLLCEKARKHGIWLQGGSINEKAEGEKRVYNTTILVNPKGEIAAIYRKVHMFDVEVASGPSFKESNSILPGNEIVVAGTDLGNIGLSICYDIRFPELYRIMTLKGAQVFFASAAFTLFTGRDHWEPILRVRAIENAAYMIAPGQMGKKTTLQMQGKSVIIDPWGNVVAKASDYPGVIAAEIDLDHVDDARSQIPALKNRRVDVYAKYSQ
jgi:predicted amidohydrolase